MKNELLSASLAAAAAVLVSVSHAQTVSLVEGGRAMCRVEIPADATTSERMAKGELEKYLALATGCGALTGDYPIIVKEKRDGSSLLKTLNDAPVVPSER